MNKQDLINEVYSRIEYITKRDITKVIDVVLEAIKQATREEEVRLINFGTFESHVREARVGRNPITGERVDVPQKRAPVFHAAQAFKNAMQ